MIVLIKLRTREQLLTQLVETLSASDVDDHTNVNKQKSKVSLHRRITIGILCITILLVCG